MKTSPRTSSARSAGQSQNGGSEALAGNPIRTAATRARSRRCTTALTKWVVPITTPSILLRAISGRRRQLGERRHDAGRDIRRGRRLDGVRDPPVLEQTASVLVPPTSMPIRRIGLCAITYAPLVEDRAEVEVVAEGARSDMIEPLRRQKDRRRREGTTTDTRRP